MLLIRFLHYLGLAMWIGGWLAGVIIFAGTRGLAAEARTTLSTKLARVYTMVVVPGAILTVASGVLWSLAMVGADDVEARVSPVGLGIMTAAGFLGGLLTVFVSLPAAIKLRAVAVPSADGKLHPLFDRLNMRLVYASGVAGLLALVSLFSAVLAPPSS